jgi:oligoendopeptidase F
MATHMRDTAFDSRDPVAGEFGTLPEWNLGDLYLADDDPALLRDQDWLRAECAAFAADFQGRLAGLGAAGMLDAIRRYERIEQVGGRLGSYAGLRYYQNTTDAARSKFHTDMNTRLTDDTAPLVFFTLELNRIDDAALRERFDASPDLARYRPWFDRVRAMKPHQLSDELEKYLHDDSVAGASAWVQLFDETMAGLTFQVDGETLALEPVLTLLTDPDRTRRETAARALATVFRANLPLFTRITNTLAKKKEVSDRWRSFAAPQDSRHLSNHVEPAVVKALRDAVVAAYPRLSHRYYALKARWLGLPKLEIWDRNAPLPQADETPVAWDQARDIVLSAYAGFAPEMADIARPFFEKGWIDAPAKPGKAPGAFAHPTVTDAHPYVLLNYLGKKRDVMTLAHELGHGVHQVLAAGQGELLASTPLTLAETASVFGEMLTFRKLLADTTDRGQRKALLASKVEDMINTVVRQIAFYDFESRLHAARRAEGELTPDRINAIWMEVTRESLGPAFDFMDGYECFWSYIPHFIHSPFYVYAYAFGDGLVNALYAVYQDGDPEFQAKYFAMLRAGGSRHHRDLLAPFGLDAADPAFWDRGIGLIDSMITELEGMD